MVGGVKRQVSASTSREVKRKGLGFSEGSSSLPILGPAESIKAGRQPGLGDTASETENVMAHRKQFKEAVALYRSAIAEVHPANCNGEYMLEVFEMANEVEGTLTTLQTQSLRLQNRIVMDSAAKVKKQARETIQAAEADRVKFEAEKAADRVRFEAEKAQAGEEAKACHICMEKPHDVVIFPCLHAHYCNVCLEKQKTTNKTCPTCRTPIVSTLRYRL